MNFFVDKKDVRNILLAQKLKNLGFCVFDFEKKPAKNGDVFVFSPAKKWTEEEILALPNGIKLFCGKVDEKFFAVLKEKKIFYFNFLCDEIFAIKNSNLTAEGVLALILEKSPKSIFESNILIFGFGRISKSLSLLFSKLGVKFCVASFSKKSFEESFFASQKNFFGFDFVKSIEDFDIFVNTRPENFLDETILSQIKPNSLFFETASIDCLDEKNAKDFFYVKAPALPQKYAPESAAEIMLDKILGELKK